MEHFETFQAAADAVGDLVGRPREEKAVDEAGDQVDVLADLERLGERSIEPLGVEKILFARSVAADASIW